MKTMHDFQQRINAWKKINARISQECFTVDGPSYLILHPEIFGGEFFSDTLANIVNQYMCANEYDRVNKDRLTSIVKTQANSEINVERLKKLHEQSTLVVHFVRKN